MSDDRVSDGLLAELQRKIDDGTPRGLVWPVIADMFMAMVPCATTAEEVAAANETLVALLADAEVSALMELEMQACIAQLRSYLDRDES